MDSYARSRGKPLPGKISPDEFCLLDGSLRTVPSETLVIEHESQEVPIACWIATSVLVGNPCLTEYIQISPGVKLDSNALSCGPNQSRLLHGFLSMVSCKTLLLGGIASQVRRSRVNVVSRVIWVSEARRRSTQ